MATYNDTGLYDSNFFMKQCDMSIMHIVIENWLPVSQRALSTQGRGLMWYLLTYKHTQYSLEVSWLLKSLFTNYIKPKTLPGQYSVAYIVRHDFSKCSDIFAPKSQYYNWSTRSMGSDSVVFRWQH